jgi:hypothetical protein
MNKEYLFSIYAPPGGPWSDWAKPVLFAHLSSSTILTAGVDPAHYNVSWAPAADGSTAIVLDLPGDTSVWVALQLAHIGYRPVPLYNALPSLGVHAVCDIMPIVAAILGAAPILDQLNLPFDSPPAFMLDANRRVGSGLSLHPGMFDNRSVSLPTDFPSANLLMSRSIKRAILVQADTLRPQEDLAHTLLRWQRAGITIEAINPLNPAAPQKIDVPRPPRFRSLWQRLLATAGLRRHPQGGFGAILPIPTSSSGG